MFHDFDLQKLRKRKILFSQMNWVHYLDDGTRSDFINKLYK